MFDFLKKNKKKVVLCSPVDGDSLPLEKVPDKIFAEKMMGDGIAFSFEGNVVCAPCNGTIILVADTLHAFGIRAENGAEILIHIGLDTVGLNRRGFRKLVEVNSKVKKGTPVIELDREVFEKSGTDLTTPMVVTNGSEYSFTVSEPAMGLKKGMDEVISFE